MIGKVLGSDENGAIESMPLQLLIMVIIAGIVIAIVLGWLFSIQGPRSIKDIEVRDGNTIISHITYDAGTGKVEPKRVIVKIYDQDSNPLAGALVVISGSGVNDFGTTNDKGEVKLDVSEARLPSQGSPIGHISIQAEKSGYLKLETDLPIVRES